MELSPVLAAPPLPSPRGDLSSAVVSALRDGGPVPNPSIVVADPLADDDLHLALYVCYELHYRGFDGVHDAREWDPSLIDFRSTLEAVFEKALRDAIRFEGDDAVGMIAAIAATATGPSLSQYVLDHGTLEEVREFAVHRSLYQLKEADPHTWGIPRLTGAAKAAIVHIQYGEYGDGDAAAMHSTLFGATMRALELDDTYGAYLDLVPGTTLATVNLMSLFGLHRRWRGALLGHLALFEMTSVGPMGRYSAALRRLGLDAEASRFYDVHVEADAVHEIVAAEMARAALAAEPHLAGDLVFGARALTHLEDRFTRSLLGAWADGTTSLLTPLSS